MQCTHKEDNFNIVKPRLICRNSWGDLSLTLCLISCSFLALYKANISFVPYQFNHTHNETILSRFKYLVYYKKQTSNYYRTIWNKIFILLLEMNTFSLNTFGIRCLVVYLILFNWSFNLSTDHLTYYGLIYVSH